MVMSDIDQLTDLLSLSLIATIVKDIDSSSILDKMLALNAAAELVSSEHLNTGRCLVIVPV